MRLIILTHGGADLLLESLAALEGVEIASVFIERPAARTRGFQERLRRSIKYDGVIETASKLFSKNKIASNSLNDPTASIAGALGVKIEMIDDFHSDGSIAMMRAANADLAVIYGTNIIKESVFSIPKLGSINLHQGLAPQYRGGPPIFWELFNGEKEVGLTVHFVAAKVDTGDIILQKTVPMEYDLAYGVNFEEFIDHFRDSFRQESADLVADAVKLIESGTAQRTPQDISIGKRYRLPVKREKDELRRRLKLRLERRASG